MTFSCEICPRRIEAINRLRSEKKAIAQRVDALREKLKEVLEFIDKDKQILSRMAGNECKWMTSQYRGSIVDVLEITAIPLEYTDADT